MKIQFIHAPFVFTDSGQRIEIDKIEGSVSIGTTIVKDGDKFKTTGISTDNSDCVGGVCPIR